MINRDLKMQYSKNFEVGLDFDMFGVKGGITYYNEKMRNGYTLSHGSAGIVIPGIRNL